jgi:hypothetical protein
MVKQAVGVLMLVSLGLAGGAQAHHSIAANFDQSRKVEIQGTVVDFKLRSPHSSMVVDGIAYIDGVQQNDKPERWDIESSALSGLRARGIEADTFKPGDSIIVVGSPSRKPELRRANSSDFAFADGREFKRQDERAGPVVATNAVGARRVAGRWRPPLQVNGDGSALPLNEAGLQAWRSFDQKLSPANTCEPMSIPVVFNAPSYYVDIRFGTDNVVVYNQAYDIKRTVPLTGQSAPADPEGRFGVVRGRIDGNALVIESRDYPVSKWGLGAATQINGGGADVPSSAQKTVTERYTVSEDGLTLIFEYDLFDPVYMRAPHHARIEMPKVADDAPMYRYDCNVESARQFSRDPGQSLLN